MYFMNTEYLMEGIVVAIIGISLVVTVLCVIALILSLFAVFNKPKEVKETAVSQAPKAEPVKIAEPTLKTADDLELIAVITAAIAQSMNKTADDLVVRSLRKVSPWNEQARSEQQNNSLF